MLNANLINYVWISEYDELRDKRVSDWGRAENCSDCGRRIVHVYTVQYEDKSYVLVGRECAHKALGIPKSAVKRHLAEAEAIAAIRAREIAYWENEALKRTSPSPAGARVACKARNRHRDFEMVLFYHKALAGYYAVPVVCTVPVDVPSVKKAISQGEALEAAGWFRVA